MKTEILDKLFSSRWNYAWGKVHEHLISLFYKKGGFSGLYDFIVSEKQRMDKNSDNDTFRNYYSSDLIETLQKANDELKDSDFRDYIFYSQNVSFNKNNFTKLEELSLLGYYYDFGGSFRGNIVDYHKIGDYAIIETLKKEDGKRFYNAGQFSTVYESLEQALLSQIFKGQFSDTLFTLLETVNTNVIDAKK